MPKTIVSYDDTLNDQDALALGRLLSHAGAELEHLDREQVARRAGDERVIL